MLGAMEIRPVSGGDKCSRTAEVRAGGGAARMNRFWRFVLRHVMAAGVVAQRRIS